MNSLMICPKVGNPKNEYSSCSACLHNKPHEKHNSCIHVDKICHYCIPYIRKLDHRHFYQGGTAVTNFSKDKLGLFEEAIKTHGDLSLVVSKKSMDNIGGYYSFHSTLNKDLGSFWKVFRNLELIKKDGKIMNENKLKYKAAKKKANLSYIYQDVVKSDCQEVFEQFKNLLWELKPDGFVNKIDTDKLIEWAEKDQGRIDWLVKYEYIEKTKSDYDKWVDECPVMASKLEVLEWAKRMPR